MKGGLVNIREATKNLPLQSAEILKLKALVSSMVKSAGGMIRINLDAIEQLDQNSRLIVQESPEGFYELRLEEPK